MTDVMREVVMWWVQKSWIMSGMWIDCLLKFNRFSR
jgi:hypothetical protein